MKSHYAKSIILATTASLTVFYLSIATASAYTAKGEYCYTKAMDAINKYISLEDNQHYVNIFEMLSTRRKKNLKSIYGVANAKSYQKFRLSAESRWHDFSLINSSSESQGVMTFTVQAKVEETGDVQSLQVVYRFVREGRCWKLDDWQY